MNKNKIIIIALLAAALLIQAGFMIVKGKSESGRDDSNGLDSISANQVNGAIDKSTYEQDSKAIEAIWNKAEEESKDITAEIAEERQKAFELQEAQRQEESMGDLSWIYGTWRYRSSYGTCVINVSEDNLIVNINGEITYDGPYTIEDGRIVYGRGNGMANVITIDNVNHRLMAD